MEQLKFGSILWKTHESSLFSCKFLTTKITRTLVKAMFFFLHCDSTCKDENLLHTLQTSNPVKSGFYFEIARDFVLQVEQRRDCELCRPLVDSTCTFRCPRSYETISFDNNFLLPFVFNVFCNFFCRCLMETSAYWVLCCLYGSCWRFENMVKTIICSQEMIAEM